MKRLNLINQETATENGNIKNTQEAIAKMMVRADVLREEQQPHPMADVIAFEKEHKGRVQILRRGAVCLPLQSSSSSDDDDDDDKTTTSSSSSTRIPSPPPRPQYALASSEKKKRWPGATCFPCRGAHVACKRNKDNKPCHRCTEQDLKCTFPVCTNCKMSGANCNGYKPCTSCVGIESTCAYDKVMSTSSTTTSSALNKNSNKRKRDGSFINSRVSPRPDVCRITGNEMFVDFVKKRMYLKEFKSKYQLSSSRKRWRATVEKIAENSVKDKEQGFTKMMARQLLQKINDNKRVLIRRKKNELFDPTSLLLKDDIDRLVQGFKQAAPLIGYFEYADTLEWENLYAANGDVLGYTKEQLNDLWFVVNGTDDDAFTKEVKLSKPLVLASISLVQDIFAAIFENAPSN